MLAKNGLFTDAGLGLFSAICALFSLHFSLTFIFIKQPFSDFIYVKCWCSFKLKIITIRLSILGAQTSKYGNSYLIKFEQNWVNS